MTGSYDTYATQYADLQDRDRRDPKSIYHTILSRILARVGHLQGTKLLDAGCGAGHLSLEFATRGASVVAIDVAHSLIEVARSRNAHDAIAYECRDITSGLPEYRGAFDVVIANLVLNDTPEYRLFIRAMGESTKPGGKAIATINNPYSAVVRGKVTDYVESGVRVEYAGLARAGIHVEYHHRTLQEYVEAFRAAGYVIEHLDDLIPEQNSGAQELRQRYGHFPFLMLLDLIRT